RLHWPSCHRAGRAVAARLPHHGAPAQPAARPARAFCPRPGQPLRPLAAMNNASAPRRPRGIVLPVVLILLVVMAFAGLMAAQSSNGLQDVSNNARMRRIAELAAESALRHCEAVVRDVVDNGGATFGALQGRFGAAVLDGPEDPD